ncbi:MAG: hypothetical protein GEV28_13130 [Actinophytocola sp.]|uniref:glycosyltransferase n=1 Tax=Actinophytocola sp. TaxID=1872138 RepID=UPI001324B5B0|nr:galactosyltransferase-related protein [Actinophytocola sp.]MPZ81282.1 hypothetical protein [Actinophytocola sp.]
MCVLRGTNPIRIRPTRSGGATFVAASAYRRAEQVSADFARRIAGYVVLAHDPAVPVAAADYWTHSAPFYRAVVEQIEDTVANDLAYRRLVANPTDTNAERHFQARLTDLLARDPSLVEMMRRRVDAADDNVYINYFHGESYQPAAAPTDVDRLTEIAGGRRARPTGTGDEILVVIPVSDRDGTGRIRNLMACLLALRDQSFPAERYRVTVVEFDERPRWRGIIEPQVDHYLHVKGHGLFNKSWTLNVGARRTPGRARTLCLLDADILVDRHFLERNHARFADPDHDAHLPHTEMLSLDQPSSDLMIEERCGAGAGQASLGYARGLLLRDVPGACLWTRPEIFHRIGGFDERYRGWGGEDEDMLYRITAAGSVTQYDDVFLHLAHRRPAMRRADGEPFNGHVPPGTWTGELGYGDPSRPAQVGAAEAIGE